MGMQRASMVSVTATASVRSSRPLLAFHQTVTKCEKHLIYLRRIISWIQKKKQQNVYSESVHIVVAFESLLFFFLLYLFLKSNSPLNSSPKMKLPPTVLFSIKISFFSICSGVIYEINSKRSDLFKRNGSRVNAETVS